MCNEIWLQSYLYFSNVKSTEKHLPARKQQTLRLSLDMNVGKMHITISHEFVHFYMKLMTEIKFKAPSMI